jgi:type I restriction enzyme R subunit
MSRRGSRRTRHLGELLDRKGNGPRDPLFISDHADSSPRRARLRQGQKPEDYLHELHRLHQEPRQQHPGADHRAHPPARADAQAAARAGLALDRAGFTETGLATAWRELTNQDIAARIVGYIRQAAIGDALVPYAERVDRALQASAGPSAGRQALDHAAARLAQAHRRPDQGQHCWSTAPRSTTPT